MPRGIYKRKKQPKENNLKQQLIKAAKYHKRLSTDISKLARKI